MQNSIGVLKMILPPHIVPSQLKILMPVGIPTTIVVKHEKTVRIGFHSDREHVVRPNAHADEPDGNGRRNHDRVPKNRLTRKHRNDFGDERKGTE